MKAQDLTSDWPACLHTVVEVCLASRFPMAVWRGPELTAIYNNAYAYLLGARHPASLGRPAAEGWGECWRHFAAQAQEVVTLGTATWNERTYMALERNGTLVDVWFTWSLSPIRDQDGRVCAILCTMTDDTAAELADRERAEVERAEAALFASRARLENILSAAEVGAWSLDLRTGRLDSDRNVAEFHGLGEADLRNRGPSAFVDRIHPEDAPRLEAALTRAHDTGDFFDPIYRIVRSDGSIRWIANRGRVISDEKGEPVSIDGVAIDVTERQLAEQRLRQSEERLALATGAAELGIIEWNAVSDVSLWENARTYEIFGRDPSAGPLNRRQAIEAGIVHPDDVQKLDLALKAASRPGGVFKLISRIKRQNDGAWRWLELAGALSTTADGKPLKLVTVVADITDRKRVESERALHLDSERAARTEAERVSHMKDEFLATLSHELRTPLNAILGWSELLKADGLTDSTRLQAVEIIDRNARVQTRLIEDLLEMSRIISGKVRLDVQAIDLADVVQAAVESAQPMAATRGVRLSKVIDAGAGKMNGDPARLQQVITNLLSNAIKFTPVGGNVRVQLAQTPNDIQVIVRDNGSGIAPDFAPFLFDRFAQAEPSHTRRFGGLGLGLSIVKQLVEMHGGSVVAESAGLGKGSTFTVSLPVVRLSAGANEDVDGVAREQDAEKNSEATKLTGIKVLVVDDEPDARELMKRVLETRDAKVVTAASAAVGLDLVERYRPDIVLSDIGMPGIDGYDFIRQVRALGAKRGGTVPAIAVTAFARAEDRERALRAGYQSHLPKPMQVHQLVAAIAASVSCSA